VAGLYRGFDRSLPRWFEETRCNACTKPGWSSPDEFLSQSTRLQEQVPNPFFGLITSGTLASKTVARGQLLRPFPQYTGVNIGSISNRNSIYHAMQVKAERRFRAGGSLLAAAW
jgi:hypothetical protein